MIVAVCGGHALVHAREGPRRSIAHYVGPDSSLGRVRRGVGKVSNKLGVSGVNRETMITIAVSAKTRGLTQ